MAFKINPIAFRLGVSRICRFTNNIYLSNFGFLWGYYFKYEKLLFLFFYKYRFWIISSKMSFLTPSSILIFCNYYKLRLYFNKRPVRRRRKRRLKRDLDCTKINFNWKKTLQNIFFKKNLKSIIKNSEKKKITLFYKVIKYNLFHTKYWNKVCKGIKFRTKRNFFKKAENTTKISFRKKFLRKLLKLKLLKKLKLTSFNLKLQKNNFLIHNSHNLLKQNETLNQKDLFLNSDRNLYDYKLTKPILYQKIFLFHLQRILKLIFLKKNISLKLRNIQHLLPYQKYRWDDALRTAYLIQIRKKHFVRNVFKDFMFLQRVAYLEMDAQLLTKLIIILFEMTKYHKRLIYLIKSIIKTMRRFYRHIRCKIKLKGKMQYKRRTKTVYLFKYSFPLNQINQTVEYGLGYANTPFGCLGIKVWLYYSSNLNYYETLNSRNLLLNKDFSNYKSFIKKNSLLKKISLQQSKPLIIKKKTKNHKYSSKFKSKISPVKKSIKPVFPSNHKYFSNSKIKKKKTIKF